MPSELMVAVAVVGSVELRAFVFDARKTKHVLRINCGICFFIISIFFNESSPDLKAKETIYVDCVPTYAKGKIMMIKRIKEFSQRNKMHLIGWASYILTESLLTAGIVDRFGKPMDYLLHYGLNISLFYGCALFVLPQIFRAKQWKWRLPVGLVGVLTSYFLAKYLIDVALLDVKAREDIANPFTKKYILGTLWRCLLFSGLSSYYYLFLRYEQSRNESANLKEDKLQSLVHEHEMQIQLNQAETAYLRAQINPHLLFNTISFIYNKVRDIEPKAAQALASLSSIFRFSIESEHTEAKPTLKEEITQIHHLIQLNALRMEGKYYVDFSYDKRINQFHFLPLILLTLAENMFKHGDLRDPNKSGVILLSLEKGNFQITTRNLINKVKLFPSLNKGLSNLERRISLAYPGHYQLTYEVDPHDFFTLNLSIRI